MAEAANAAGQIQMGFCERKKARLLKNIVPTINRTIDSVFIARFGFLISCFIVVNRVGQLWEELALEWVSGSFWGTRTFDWIGWLIRRMSRRETPVPGGVIAVAYLRVALQESD